MEKTKICSNPDCIHGGKPQPISNFGKHKKSKDGYNWRCKDCIRKYNLDHKDDKKLWREQNEEHVREYFHKYNIEHKDEVAEKSHRWYEANKDRKIEQEKEWQKNNRKKFHEYSILWNNSPALYDTYFERLSKYMEVRKDPENNEYIQVKCYNSTCGNWFTPTNANVQHRLQSIDGTLHGENNLYCSDECKKTCTVFGKRSDASLLKPSSGFDNFYQKIIRKNIMQDELSKICLAFDNYTCQHCLKSTDEYPDLILHAHHTYPVTLEPIFASDLWKIDNERNVITLCEECHRAAHKSDACNAFNLSQNKYDFETILMMTND